MFTTALLYKFLLGTSLQSSGVVRAHAHLLHPLRAHGLTNQQAKKLVGLLAVSLTRLERNTESTTSMTVIRAVSSPESSCLANCRQLHASDHCCLVLYGLSKKLVFVPVASAMTGAHRDRLVLASIAQ